ncbi:MAG: hypothetical protein K2K30_00645 [Alistipes sp.]|nr:hypothetical protein [Alistipes sp.]
MKKILRNLTCGLLLCGGLFAGCADVDDVIEDIPYSRTLTPLNFEAEVVASVGTSITFSWSSVANADSYVLEVFAGIDSTDDAGKAIVVEPDYTTALPDYTFDVNPDEVPFTIADMTVDKSYYARVRAVAASIAGSHWAYLTDYVSTSAVRSNLNPVVKERTEKSVTISWDDAEDKTDLTSVRCEPVVAAEGIEAVTVALTDEEIENCSFAIDGLVACTNYKFTLLFGKSGSRGVVTAWTRPDTEGTTRIESSEAFVNAISDAAGDLKLLLAYNDGATYDLTPIMTLNASENIYDPFEFAYGLEIYGESTEDGLKPVVNMALKNSGEAAFHFEDIMIDGGNRSGVFFVTGAKVVGFEMINCEITGFSKGLYNGAAGCDCGDLIFDGVYAHDINPLGEGAGDFIDIRGGNYGKVDVVNSTFYAAARTFLRISETATQEVGSINVSNCTFNQVTATSTSSNNSGIFHVRYSPTSKPAEYLKLGSFTLTNCVFLNMNNDAETENSWWVRLTRDSNENYAPTCVGNIFYNIGHMYDGLNGGQNTFFPTKSLNLDGEAFTAALALAEGGMMLEEDPCSNSIAGKMYLKNGIITANRAGDPRWWNASEPVIVRPTELTVVTEPTVWDFTEKTKFQTETVETSTIIENIRIYGPAEIVMNEGVTFASAATVNDRNVPQTNAFGFLAQGVGAVEVTAQGNTVSSTVQIVVGSDAYSVLADGATHKVILGDLSGENNIYVLAGAPCTVTNIAWTDDLTPEATTTALAAPVVTVDPASLFEGTMEAVTASWAAVENAAEYEVTFNGKKATVAETQFVIDAATVASLRNGSYPVSVVAKPVATSTKYTPSEAGEASFSIKVDGTVKTLFWEFAKFDGSNLTTQADEKWTDNTAFVNNAVWSLYEATPLTIMKGVAVAASQSVAKLSGFTTMDTTPNQKALYFTAPYPGTLTVVHKSANSSTARGLYVTVVTDGVAKTVFKGDKILTETTDVVDLNALEGGETVYIHSDGNNAVSVRFDYVDPNDKGAEYTYDWDMTAYTPSEAAQMDSSSKLLADDTYLATDANSNESRVLNVLSTGSNWTLDAGKQLKSGGASKFVAHADGDGSYTATGRALSFVAQGPGVLYLTMKSASASDTNRAWAVSADKIYYDSSAKAYLAGNVYSSATCPASTNTEAVEIDCSDVQAGQTVYISVAGAINFVDVKWVETR